MKKRKGKKPERLIALEIKMNSAQSSTDKTKKIVHSVQLRDTGKNNQKRASFPPSFGRYNPIPRKTMYNTLILREKSWLNFGTEMTTILVIKLQQSFISSVFLI